jgi:hypothetical protein
MAVKAIRRRFMVFVFLHAGCPAAWDDDAAASMNPD